MKMSFYKPLLNKPKAIPIQALGKPKKTLFGLNMSKTDQKALFYTPKTAIMFLYGTALAVFFITALLRN